MPSSEYQKSVGGGLRLKGSKNAGIDKKRKKKKLASKTQPKEDRKEGVGNEEPQDSSIQAALADEDTATRREVEEKEQDIRNSGKTDAQKRHDEMRKKRLDDRLKREGVKTHKQRVEELNKYLSGLSEHHDMPRIGPG